jgi:hypothetical protein
MPYRDSQISKGNIMEEQKEYVVPEIVSYTYEEILAELGDVQTVPPVSPI